MDAPSPNAYRMRLESAVYTVLAVCFLVFGLVEAIRAVSDGSVGHGLVELAAIWSVAGFLALRMARLGVVVRQNGILVRNPLKTSTIPWREVRGFTLHRYAFGVIGIVDLHDGRRIRLWGIQPRNRVTFPNDRRAERAIGGLNRELQVARGATSSHFGHS